MAPSPSAESSNVAAGMGSGPGGAFLKPDACSNNEPGSCLNRAAKDCTNCHLVQYCGIECQKTHWPTHKADCRSPLGKLQWCPDYIQKYRSLTNPGELGDSIDDVKNYWGNTPEYDILNLEANEGRDYDKDLDLLFAASGDLRCAMKTINEIPPSYQRNVEVVLNELETDIVLRNAVILLLAFLYPGGEASELIIHFWYSAALPSEMYMCGVAERVVPLIKEVCDSHEAEKSHAIISNEWDFGDSSLRLTLKKHQWMSLLDRLELKNILSIADATDERNGVMVHGLNEAQRDHVDGVWLNRNPFHRASDKKWRETGLLLPFAHDRQGFDIPNPTLFGPSKEWLVTWSPRQIPFTGSDIIVHGYDGPKVPSNDTTGMLFFVRRGMIEKFCKAIQMLRVNFSMYQGDAQEIGRTLKKAGWHRPDFRFDRIDTSNIADDGYLRLPMTLSACGPLLKKQRENPHATLLTHFMMVTTAVETHQKKKWHEAQGFPAEKEKLVEQLLTESQKNWGNLGKPSREYGPWWSFAAMMLKNHEDLFERYRHIYQFTDSALGTGVEERAQNKITDKFPHQVNINQDLDDLRKQVQLRMGYLEGAYTFSEWSSHDRVERQPERKQGEAFTLPGNPGMMMSLGFPGLGPDAGGLSNVMCFMDEEGKKNMEKLAANMNMHGGLKKIFEGDAKQNMAKMFAGMNLK